MVFSLIIKISPYHLNERANFVMRYYCYSPITFFLIRTIYGTIIPGGENMIAISSSQVRSHFKEVCDQVINDVESVIVTRTRGENVVMMSEEEYNNMIENFRIFSNPEIYNKIKTGIDQIEHGNTNKRELIDETNILIASCKDHYK